MSEQTILGRVEQAIIFAFTLTVALIWKDVIIGVIEVIVPPSEELTAKILAAILSTILVVAVIYFLLRTELKAKHVIKQIRKPQA